MHYEKPIIMDLNNRKVNGKHPDSCYQGDTPGGFGVCGVGSAGSAGVGACQTGYGALGDPFETLCLAGNIAQFCDMGAGGTEYGDNCTAGPSNIDL